MCLDVLICACVCIRVCRRELCEEEKATLLTTELEYLFNNVFPIPRKRVSRVGSKRSSRLASRQATAVKEADMDSLTVEGLEVVLKAFQATHPRKQPHSKPLPAVIQVRAWEWMDAQMNACMDIDGWIWRDDRYRWMDAWTHLCICVCCILPL